MTWGAKILEKREVQRYESSIQHSFFSCGIYQFISSDWEVTRKWWPKDGEIRKAQAVLLGLGDETWNSWPTQAERTPISIPGLPLGSPKGYSLELEVEPEFDSSQRQKPNFESVQSLIRLKWYAHILKVICHFQRQWEVLWRKVTISNIRLSLFLVYTVQQSIKNQPNKKGMPGDKTKWPKRKKKNNKEIDPQEI